MQPRGSCATQLTGLLFASLVFLDWKGGQWASQYIQVRHNLNSTSEVWSSIHTNSNLPTPVTNLVIDAGATNTLFYQIRAER